MVCVILSPDPVRLLTRPLSFFSFVYYIVFPINPTLWQNKPGLYKSPEQSVASLFTRWTGQFYARSKSSLDGRRVRKDPKFRRTMQEAGEFGKASKAVRELYWQMPEEKRKHGMYGRLTGKMRKLLKAGKSLEEAKLALMQELDMAAVADMQKPVQKNIPAAGFTEQLLQKVFAGEGNALPDVIFTERISRDEVVGRRTIKAE